MKCALQKVNRATKTDVDANLREEFGPQLKSLIYITLYTMVPPPPLLSA